MFDAVATTLPCLSLPTVPQPLAIIAAKQKLIKFNQNYLLLNWLTNKFVLPNSLASISNVFSECRQLTTYFDILSC